jgi:hypothetical protein
MREYEYCVDKDPYYAPGGYLLCRRVVGKSDFNTRRNADTVLFQADWDRPALASLYGWIPCCGTRHTDGTVDCPDCGATVGELLADAADYLDNHLGDILPDTTYAGAYFGE